MATKSQDAGYETYVKKGPDGETLKRAVYSAADAVSARFDGYFPEGDKAGAKATGAGSNKGSTGATGSSASNA
jgi:hypothetical protein